MQVYLEFSQIRIFQINRLCGDGNGLVLIHKKLERGRFMSFEHIKQVTEINSNELVLILNGGQIPLSKSGKKLSLKR